MSTRGGMYKRKRNWKARLSKETVVCPVNHKIQVNVEGFEDERYDECNALVLPSQKRKTKMKVKADNIPVERVPSRRQRRLLQQVLDRKQKKENRAQLLEALAQVQAPAEEMTQLTSIATAQTMGLKRLHSVPAVNHKGKGVTEAADSLSSIAGSRKHRHLMALEGCYNGPPSSLDDPNVVGLEDSSDDTGEDDIEEWEEAALPVQEDEGSVVPEGNALLDTADKGKESQSGDLSLDTPIVTTVEAAKEPPVPAPIPNMVCKPAVFVPVHRTATMQEARMKLPILSEEQSIMEAVGENPVVVLAGETGSGKTTQVPQFLYEAGYASGGKMIGITEPRRVAAVSMSRRVAHEMNLSECKVSYLIRFEGNATEDTCIKFMTDGVLLKEIQSDFLLHRYSAILIDEAHERSVYSDILLGLLSRIIPLRERRGNPLKLLVMSATLRLEDFVDNCRLFPKPPPVIKVESRQYPVMIHFNKRTKDDYVAEAFSKVCKIHNKLPDGGILVFLTGQLEVNGLVKKLRRTFPYRSGGTAAQEEVTDKKLEAGVEVEVSEESEEEEYHIPLKARTKKHWPPEVQLPPIDLDEFPVVGGQDDDLSLDEDHDELEIGAGGTATRQPMWVLPLYSLLPGHEQAKVFKEPPTGCRLCVVATNVAETSLTIPGVRYVVDSGRMKVRQYDRVTGVSAFHIQWTSKASANQRAGRAGRVAPGHCYRLYSSAVFNNYFEEFTPPEIQMKPVDDLVLQMKSMGIHKVVNFPFPSPPSLLQLQAAERQLILLGALEPVKGCVTEDWTSRVTPLGHAMASFPVAPRFAKMLALSHQHHLLPYTICIVAALAVPEVLMQGDKTWMHTRRTWAGTGNSLLLGDPMVLMCAIGAAEHAGTKSELPKFCQQNGVRHKAVTEVRKLRLQLTTEVNLAVPDLNLAVDPSMAPPSDVQSRRLRQILVAGMVDHVARHVDPTELKEEEDRIKWKRAYRCGELEEPVRIHSSSVLRQDCPKWVVYQEVFETDRLYMRGVTAIEPEWLPVYAPTLCHLEPPLADPEPRYDSGAEQLLCHVTGTFGRAAWQLPVMEIEFPPGLDRYKWFARFLLEGLVFPKLQRFRLCLLSSPPTMVKTWANLQPRTEILLKALVEAGVDSTKKLRARWEKDKSYLLPAYQTWVPESAHNEVAMVWPPL